MRISFLGCMGYTFVLSAILIPRDGFSQAPVQPAAPVCKPGYVWREAFPGDTVCVAPRRRDDVRAENRMARSRVQPGGGAYGPDTCVNGYVWRETRATDHVCVLPISRDIVARENASAEQFASHCSAAGGCTATVQTAQRKVETLRRRLAQRQRDLAKARNERRRMAQQLREEDEKWMRDHPGLGRSTQPSIADNVSPIEQDIRQIEAALKAAELESAKARSQEQAQAQVIPRGRQ